MVPFASKPSLRHRLQSALAGALLRAGMPSWYDVATFSPGLNHRCVRCGRRSATERTHLSHDCWRRGMYGPEASTYERLLSRFGDVLTWLEYRLY